jgi:IS4 transposase
MEGKSLSSELLEAFNFSGDCPSVSALCQARLKILPSAFKAIFERFVSKEKHPKTFRGFRLLAHDGSSITLPLDPEDQTTYMNNTRKPFNALHLEALYDILNHDFVTCDVENRREANERKSLLKMAKCLPFKTPVILIADRGYRSLNVYEHLKESGQYFVIRELDVTSNGFLAHTDLPKDGEFDEVIDFELRRAQKKKLRERKNSHFLSTSSVFDFLPEKSKESYPMSLRAVRIKLGEDSYTSLVTNLPADKFSQEDLNQLYHYRWGIETAFRDLKYSLGLERLHAKNKQLIEQEIYARLIMYNFSQRIVESVVLPEKDRQYAYQINVKRAIAICRHYFKWGRGDIELLLRKELLPVRLGRKDKRKMKNKTFKGFLYRIA